MKYIGWWLSGMLMLLVLMMVSCSQDSSSDPVNEPQGSPLRLSSVRRASTSFTPSNGSSIKMYVMTQNAQFSEGTFNFTTSWSNNNVSVKEHEQYYMYGFMPGDYDSSISAASSDLNGDYSKGADLTISGLPIFTSKDICAIVGVGRVSSGADATEAEEGNYGYLSGLNSENYVNLLMDHVYSKLILNMNVENNYSLLRDIKLKSVKLVCSYGASVNVTIKHRASYGLQNNAIVYSPVAGETPSHTIWSSDVGSSLPSQTATPLLIGSLNCPPVVLEATGQYMKIVCNYDVYDKKGNKLRECEGVENKLKVSNITSGMEYTVTLTVAPTYVYVLSDDDLNNPTIKIN